MVTIQTTVKEIVCEEDIVEVEEMIADGNPYIWVQQGSKSIKIMKSHIVYWYY